MFIIYFLFSPLFLGLFEILNSKEKSFSFMKKISFWSACLYSFLFCYAIITITSLSFTAFLEFTPLRAFISLTSAFFFATMRLILPTLKNSKSILSFLMISLCVAIFLEGTVFNLRSYQTYYYEPIKLSTEFDVPTNLNPVANSSTEYTATANSTISFEFEQLNQKIHNIYFDVSATDNDGNVKPIKVNISFTDESNKLYLRVPSQTTTSDVESTKYLYLVTSGVSEKLKISFSSEATNYSINNITLNTPKPLSFNFVRLFLTAFIIFIVFILRPKSYFYNYKLSFSPRQRMITAMIVAAEIVMLFLITTFNPVFESYPSSHHAQYNQLAEAFLDGRLYLAKEPPEFLLNMENPYDYYHRTQQAAVLGQTYYWDAAYFGGHYYVYFGVLPVLLFYLPFKALTGLDLPNRAVIQICLSLFVIGAFVLIEKIIKKFFNPSKIPYLTYLVLSLIFVNASGAVFIAKRPDFYSIPIIMSLALVAFGLYFWLCSTDSDQKIRPMSAFAGSLCMAAVAACRPQFLLASVLAIILFWSAVFKERTLFSKKSISSTIAICLPYVIIAAGLMWYNYSRFGSPFDFGQNYNLTTNDMTGRGIRFERVGLAFFTYFLQPPNVTATFPFVESVRINTNYLGTTITEAMFGGIFATIPILWILVVLPSISEKLKKSKLFYMVLTLLGLSVFIGLFDAQGAGLLQRYVADYAYLAILAAILVVLFLYEHSRGPRKLSLNSFTAFSLYGSGIYCFFIIFAVYGTEIFYHNYTLFANVAQLIQFWK